ncbi:MAG: DUF3488 domain-containing transglutaminase family protein [Planctomycetes bacterium]|nr:DUF3488 domain-containing transglutaminase family protein [Planctomycetota bacterium]
MRVDRNLRLALLLLVLIGSFILSLGEESYLFFFIAIVACAAHWFGMDEWQGMSEERARLLVGVAALVALMERVVFEHYVIICTAHFLALSQLIVLWTKPDNRRIALIILITLAHAAVGTVRTVELGYGLCIILLTVCVSWALVLFLLRRETNNAGTDRTRPADGMVRPSLRVGACVLAVGVGVFFILPRTQANMFRQNIVSRAQAISGFSERCALGDLGRIKMSSQKVMDVKLTTKDGQPTQAKGVPLYWRGTALDTYRFEGGRWAWTRSRRRYRWKRKITDPMFGFARGGGELVQTITLEPINTRVLFALYPIESLHIQGWAGEVIFYEPVAGMMVTRAPRTKIIKYVVVSDVLPFPPNRPLREEDRYPRREERSIMQALTTVPAEIDWRVEGLARQITRSAATPRAKARLLEDYLRDSGGYKYTTDMYTTPGAEPVSDFLLKQKQGHCEYFASGMVIMLRTLGIPARMVNGFHGGEWNEFGRFYVVRQSDAHSWVEAYFPETGWQTFDPTPAVTETPAFGMRMAGLVRRLTDFFDITWVNLFIAYSRDDQREFFGAAAQNALNTNGFKGLEELANRLLTPIANLLAKGPKETEEAEGETGQPGIVRASKVFAVLVLTILAAAVIVCGLFKIVYFLFGKRLNLDTPGLLYDRFSTVVERQGFQRRPGQTPWEFAVLIASSMPEWAEDVQEITVRFCGARYGRQQLSPETIGDLKARISRLAASSR